MTTATAHTAQTYPIAILQPPDTLDLLRLDWVASMRAASASPRTIDAYGRDVGYILGYVPRPAGAAALTPESLDRALSADTRDRAPSSVQRARAALRAFGAWLADTGRCAQNPARNIKVRRVSGASPDHLTDAEVRRLLKTVRQTDTATARRDRVWIEVLLWTGIRVGELASLDIADIDLDDKHMRVRVKGGAVVSKFLRTDLRGLLSRHIKAVKKQGGQDGALWLSNQGTRLTVRQIERQCGAWLSAAGIAKRLGPHGLRHTFATSLYERTGDVLLVQRALGHANIETTKRYTHINDEEMQDAIERL